MAGLLPEISVMRVAGYSMPKVHCFSESGLAFSELGWGSSFLQTQQNLASGGFNVRHFGLLHQIGSRPSFPNGLKMDALTADSYQPQMREIPPVPHSPNKRDGRLGEQPI
jgi:hypothetical protein